MQTVQLGARFDKTLIDRIRKLGERRGGREKELIEICLVNFLPVLESGVYGTPVWDAMKRRLDEDLAAWTRQMESTAAAQKPKKAAA